MRFHPKSGIDYRVRNLRRKTVQKHSKLVYLPSKFPEDPQYPRRQLLQLGRKI